MSVNGQWRLCARPTGMVDESHFEYVEEPPPKAGEGEVVVRNLYISFDPAMRGWLNDVKSYVPPVQIGEVMRASAVGQVVETRHPDYQEGELVTGMFGWQQYARVGEAGLPLFRVPKETPPHHMLSVFGATGLTAYFGVLEVGRLCEGDAVLVSGAAGATGSVAAQIARVKGASKVVGIAGGERKCNWLLKEAELDGVIDYKSENLRQRLREEFPRGINFFFDNVGGETLDTALLSMANHGSVVLCGAISQYNENRPPPGPRNIMQVVIRRLTVRGFIVIDYLDQSERALAELGQWVRDGRIAHAEDIQEGIEKAPRTLMRLFQGENLGKQLLKVADPL